MLSMVIIMHVQFMFIVCHMAVINGGEQVIFRGKFYNGKKVKIQNLPDLTIEM